MKRMISALFIGVFAFAILAVVPAEAQYRRRNGGWYGGGWSGGGYGANVWDSWNRRPYQGGDIYEYPYSGQYQGSWGRIVNGGEYFDALVVPCKTISNRQRTQKFAAKVLAGIIGGAVLDRNNRKRGAILGGAAGTAWGLADDSNFCSPPQQIMLPVNPTAQVHQQAGQQIPYEEPTETVASYQQPVAGSMTEVPVKKIVRNRFENAPIRVYDGATKVLELASGTDDGSIETISSSRIWGEAKLENPSNGNIEWVPLQVGKGIDELPEEAGWVFGNPNTRPSL